MKNTAGRVGLAGGAGGGEYAPLQEAQRRSREHGMGCRERSEHKKGVTPSGRSGHHQGANLRRLRRRGNR